jgi:hypothetical protein
MASHSTNVRIRIRIFFDNVMSLCSILYTVITLYTLLQVEHGCSVATIAGARGVLVVGGATGDDVVEFLDWDEQTKWRTLGKLNRGRGIKLKKKMIFFRETKSGSGNLRSSKKTVM